MERRWSVLFALKPPFFYTQIPFFHPLCVCHPYVHGSHTSRAAVSNVQKRQRSLSPVASQRGGNKSATRVADAHAAASPAPRLSCQGR